MTVDARTFKVVAAVNTLVAQANGGPANLQQGSADGVTYQIDTAPVLASLGVSTLSAVTSVLNNVTPGAVPAVIPLPDTPTWTGTVVTQTVRPELLLPRATYRLDVLYTPSGAAYPLTCALFIFCPF